MSLMISCHKPIWSVGRVQSMLITPFGFHINLLLWEMLVLNTKIPYHTQTSRFANSSVITSHCLLTSNSVECGPPLALDSVSTATLHNAQLNVCLVLISD